MDFDKIIAAINLLSAEKKIPKEKIVSIIESSLVTAYRKDYGSKDEKVNVSLDLKSWELSISIEKTVVSEVKDSSQEISFEELGEDAGDYEEGDVIEIDVTDEVIANSWDTFGRIASQAARQVILQKIWDTEKEKIYELFKWKQWEVVNMRVDLVEWWKIIFDYNWNQIVLPKWEQVARDTYVPDQRFYIYVAEVIDSDVWSPRVVLSRKRKELVPAIFAEFVPEIWEDVVSIDNVVRQPWVKTKILVSSNYEEIDPAGTLIGQKWMRVKAVMEELSWEKIDIIPNDSDVREVIKRSLTPAKVISVEVDEEAESAVVYIPVWDRARAVWRNWVNVNLASQLVGYKISIEEVEVETEKSEEDE